MRLKPRTWFLISLLLFAASYGTWRYAEGLSAARRATASRQSLLKPPAPAPTGAANVQPASKRKSYRVSNTPLTERQLIASDHAIILRNALIDTHRPLKLDIPAHLRAKGAPGSYLVQCYQPLTQPFYDELKKDGAAFISFIPNNAALVKATPDQAQQIADNPMVQAVLSYEPYYKLATALLPAAVAQEQPAPQGLNVTTFPGQRDAALAALTSLGAKLMGEDSSPFGPTLSVMVPPDKLVAVAQLPLAQEIEPYAVRRALNDLTRVALGVSADTLPATSNYMNLTGANVTVNLNDTGVDTNHPDLKGRITGLGEIDDYNGHGTHVAGIIMGNGSESKTVTNASGSVQGASFRGKATNAWLFVQSLDLGVGVTVADAFLVGGSLISDALLQVNASSNLGPTNLISNNSWGYGGVATYDMHAASYDAATRDAQPAVRGEQPLLFVFAAGPGGNGNNNGTGGLQGSILSPATAKNVITVGAVDSPRSITNGVTFDGVSTNSIFLPWTDNNNFVTWFSSCGNVDVDPVTQLGRFKPDVVAPGMFTVSCRATNYVDPTNETEVTTYPFPNQVASRGQTNDFTLILPADMEELVISVTPNELSPVPFPGLNIYGDTNWPPSNLLGGGGADFLALSNGLTAGPWYFGITPVNGQIQPVAYDVTFYVVETNDLGVGWTNHSGYFYVMSNLNSQLGPGKYYMYQYGTSMSAAAVSGMLALMQEFLQTKLDPPLTNPSPALLKALLINGSRNLNPQYDFNQQPRLNANEQGWGLPNLPNSLPGSLTNGSTAKTSLLFVDQSPTNALATGQFQSYTLACADTNAPGLPVRITLVWTDPPGDPAAGLALVNNLDLIVTDSSTNHNLWLGNDFLGGDVFTEVSSGDLPDLVNNVQNVYIDSTNAPFTFPLTVTVLGTRVNVNAATTQTNQIAQDYALVVSSDDTALTQPLQMTSAPIASGPIASLTGLIGRTNANGASILPTNFPPFLAGFAPTLTSLAQGNDALITIASNGVPLLHQRAGANEPNLYTNGILYPSGTANTNGSLVQWHFFIFTNDQFIDGTNATNVAITTFMPPNLATEIPPRTNGADIDMYVSTNPALLTLDSNVIAQSVLGGMASLSRGGTETVILVQSNLQNDVVYYIGIKSEDQQAADFGFFAIAQQAPFSSQNPDGSRTAPGIPVPAVISDAELGPPGLVFAFMSDPFNPTMQLRNVTVSLGIEHGNPSDLYGTLQHNETQIVLNNYSGPPGGFTNSYDDLNDNVRSGSVFADGPGTLKGYISASGQGAWILTETDTAYLQSGQVNSFSVTGYPQPLGLFGAAYICGQQWWPSYVLVPNDATNMQIILQNTNSTATTLGIYLTNSDAGAWPSFSAYGTNALIEPNGTLTLNYSITNTPPLDGGLWYWAIYDFDSGTNDCETINWYINFGLSLVPNLVQTFTNTTPVPLTTDATNLSQICYSAQGRQVVDLSVGVRLADTNLDDLVLQLTSPQGTSIVLFENRGGVLASNLGLTLPGGANSNYVYTVFTEDTNLAGEPIKFAPPPYATAISNSLIILSTNGGFEGVASGAYTNGQSVPGTGWLVETNEASVMTDPNVAHTGSNFLALASGRLSQTFTTVPGAAYELRYYARSPGLTDWWPADDNTVDIAGANNGTIPYSDVTFDVGEVGRAFTFLGESTHGAAGSEVDFGTTAGNFGTNSFTIDFWIKEPVSATGFIGVLEKRPDCDSSLSAWSIKCGTAWYDSHTGPGQLLLEDTGNSGANGGWWISSKAINDGIFHHVAFVRNGVNPSIYVDGFLDTNTALVINGIADLSNSVQFRVGNSICTGAADGTQQFVGDLDELDLWQRALSPAEIHAIYTAGGSGKYSTNSLYPNFQLAIDGIATNTVIITNFAQTNWQACTNSFIATSNQTTIELAGNPLGVLFDDVQLVQLPYTNYNNYYLPEEPLAPLIGQDPRGCWTLSVWDTRLDSPLPTDGVLLSWTLQVTTSSTNVNLFVLTNGVSSPLTAVGAGGIVYFGIDVPQTANFATNILSDVSGGPMSLYFNQNSLPTGGLPGDVTLTNLNAGMVGTNILSTEGAPPPLVPGQRYFLGVQNTGSAPASFTLQVNFDVSVNTNIIALTNNVPMTTAIGTNGAQFYSFLVPTNVSMVTFQLLNVTNGSVDLYAREGLPVPGPLSFDYQSANQTNSDQFIVVTTNSLPVPIPVQGANILPLASQTWYLSVYNFTGVTNTGYTILATYVTNNVNGAPGAMDIVPLTNNVPCTTTAPPGFPTNLMYSFIVTGTNAVPGVQFTVTNVSTNGNVELLASDGVFPTPNDFYIGSFNPGTSTQSVTIGTNLVLTTLSNVTWYLAVPNTSGSNVTYSITATVITNGGPVQPRPAFIGASIASPTNGFTMYWTAVPGQSYTIEVSTNLTSWTTVTNITVQTATGSYTDAVPVMTQTSRFFRLSSP